MAKTTISLNIPKSAAERAARSVLFDILGRYRVGDINHEQAAEAIEHWRTSINASLQGEDAVERVAQTIREYCIGVSPASIQVSHGVERIYYAGLPVLELARAILATGLAPDERTKCAKVADDYQRRCCSHDGQVTSGLIAAAIRSGGGE